MRVLVTFFCILNEKIICLPKSKYGFEHCRDEACTCPEGKLPCEFHGEGEDYKGCILKLNKGKCCPLNYIYVMNAFADTCSDRDAEIHGGFQNGVDDFAACPPHKAACGKQDYLGRISNTFICLSENSQCNGKCARNRKLCQKLTKCITEVDWKYQTCVDGTKHKTEDFPIGWIIFLSVCGVFFFCLSCLVMHAIFTCHNYRASGPEDSSGTFTLAWIFRHIPMYCSGRMQIQMKKESKEKEIDNAEIEVNEAYGEAYDEDYELPEIVDYNDYYA